jgi:preprotein translocase subunit SecD
MQKNLLLKIVIIFGVLLVFLYGIFRIPSSLTGEGLKQAVLKNIHLGLDLKGGTHLILQVMVNEAVSTQTDSAIESLKNELQQQKVAFTDIGKPDADHPERILIQGVSLDGASQLRSVVSDHFQDYDLTAAANGAWTLTMKPAAVNDVKTRAVDQSIEAIRNRVDQLGVSEPVIQRNGMGNDQILVQLPGVDDPGRVKEIIQSTARLEIRQVFNGGSPYPSEQDALKRLGFLPPGKVLMHVASVMGGQSNPDQVYLVSKIPVVGGTDIKDARPSTDEQGRPDVSFNLLVAAGQKFAAFTGAHNETGPDPDHYLAVVLDNKIREVASIKSEIRDSGSISGGGFTDQSAKDLSMLLRSGALPASLHYREERSVGPSLGADSIRSGVRAAIWGMVAVLVFMLIYYRGAGINANVALIFNLIILLGFMGFFGAVLTLPGIAGVILTVGMGVDSNVLIFERIREELRNNKAPAAAVDQGFSRAWTTILDTHVTTIVSALILIFVGSGPVSGFGLTLTFGLLANLFTAVLVSRVIFDVVLSRKQRGQTLSI